MGAFKNFLKKFMPPPVDAFNRELGFMRDFVQKETRTLSEEQHAEIERVLEVLMQQQKQINIQQWQMESLSGKLQELERKTAALGSQMEGLRPEIAAFGSQITELSARVGRLDKFGDIEKSFRESLGEQGEKIAQMLSEGQKANEKAFGAVSKTLADNSRTLVRLPGISNQLNRIEQGTKRTTPQPRLAYFVLNILDHCNLRCKGCDHFACIAEERFVSLENISRDVARMSELMHGAVTRIGVMGGEPLLHPDLIEILKVTREAFPDTLIQLVTNGLLLLKQSEEFWTCCRENNIVIVNTKYPIKLDFDRMQETARAHGVKFEFYADTGEVQKTSYSNPLDLAGRQDPVASYWTCFHANNCNLLMEGKLYNCTIAPNIRIFNKKFGTHMELESGDYLDIYEARSAEEVLRFLATPKPFCRYCMSSKRTYGHPWERSKQEMSEWLPD